MKQTPLLALLVLLLTGCCSGQPTKTQSKLGESVAPPVDLLPGHMDQWESVNFGGEGVLSFEEGLLNLDYGNPLTGAVYKDDLASLLGEDLDNYAITLQAKRVGGVDMFLGLTFPVGTEGHVSLVLGGWAGAVTGLSNLDGRNASENATTEFYNFEDDRWYDVKVVVTPERIECWLDDKQLVNIKRADYKKYDTHVAVELTKPLGMFSYSTWGQVREMKVWKLK